MKLLRLDILWGRAGACAVRLTHYVAGCLHAIWTLLYSDDGWLVGRGDKFEIGLLLHMFVLMIIGTPLAWHKLYAWSCAGNRFLKPRIPVMLLLVMTFLENELGRSRMSLCGGTLTDLGELFRLDLKADGEDVVIGGWLS